VTVSAQTPINSSAGNGVTTVFPYTFKIVTDADIEVTVDSVAQTLNVDYTVSGAGDDSGGSVTFGTAPASLTLVVLRRNMALIRETDFQDQGEIPAATLDSDFDSAVLMIQQVDEQIGRALTLPAGVTGVSAELPSPVASAVFAWNANADAIENKTLVDLGALALPVDIEYGGTGATTAAAARTNLSVAPRATRIDVASAATLDLTTNAPDTDDIRLTGTTQVTLVTIAVGRVVRVVASAAPSFANNANIVTQTGATLQLAAGDTLMLRATASNVVEVLSYSAAAGSGVIPHSHLAGLTLSTAGSSTTMSIAAGQAADSTNAVLMSLASAISKTTSAWVVGSGNGGLDTGAIANSTWYHWYVIRRPDTGVVDVIFSLSASTPTLPASYTQYRRIGSGKTNGSAQWEKFIQDGDYVQKNVATLDVNINPANTNAQTLTLDLPTGVNVVAEFNFHAFDATNANQISVEFSDLAIADTAPSFTVAPLGQSISAVTNSVGGAGSTRCRTNTSAQVRARLVGSPGYATTAVLRVATKGWIDKRGKDL
jgi:hypothetical protein